MTRTSLSVDRDLLCRKRLDAADLLETSGLPSSEGPDLAGDAGDCPLKDGLGRRDIAFFNAVGAKSLSC